MSEPSKKITAEDVRHVAKLARLSLDENTINLFTVQLENILKNVDKISQLDVTGIEPMAHALPLTNVLREDVVEPSLTIEEVLRNAPEIDDRFFKVPKIIGGDELDRIRYRSMVLGTAEAISGSSDAGVRDAINWQTQRIEAALKRQKGATVRVYNDAGLVAHVKKMVN